MHQSFKQKYEKQQKLGEGTYGIVYKAIDNLRQLTVAIKEVKTKEMGDEGIPATSLREFSVLKRLSHPFIVVLYEIIVNPKDNSLNLVFEYHPQDLRQLFKKIQEGKVGNLNLEWYQQKFYEILSAMDYCHSTGILHRDLKPQNILVSEEGNLKIADWGLARNYTFPQNEKSQDIITLWYRPPEILLGLKEYSLEVDMWSVGCILAEFVTLRPIFYSDGSQIDQIFKIFQVFGTPNNEQWPEMFTMANYKPTFPQFKSNNILKQNIFKEKIGINGVDLIEKLLKLDPKKRINSHEALKHPFFNGFIPKK